MHLPDEELIHVTSRKECISTSHCAKQNSSPSLSAQHHLLGSLFLLMALPPSLPPRLKISLFTSLLFSTPTPTPTPQQAVCCQFCLPIISHVCCLLCSHCCCPNSGSYYLWLGLHPLVSRRVSLSHSNQSYASS